MTNTEYEVLSFVEENDVKFIRLNFCDIFGMQKNISIMADGLESAFRNGVSFDAHAIRGFTDVTQSDLLLFPDPSTLTVLPWRPGPGRVVRFYCDIKNPDGSIYPHDSRNILRKVLTRCTDAGYICKVGPECEFYLFKTDEYGKPTDTPIDEGGYLDISPLDRGADIRREICLTLEEMGIQPESSHHEQGPGQNEIDFKFGNALEGADNVQTLKAVVREIAARNGCFASFMPKPIKHAAGSGMHINLSLSENGMNIFEKNSDKHNNVSDSFIAGILAGIPEITIFLNPLANSYERPGKFEAPKYISHSHQNRSQLIRIPAATGKRMRMELRSPDPSVNPYLAFALVIAAGMNGINNNIPLSPAVDIDLNKADVDLPKSIRPLPANMEEAISLAENSHAVADVLGKELLEKYLNAKKAEVQEFMSASDRELYYKKNCFTFT